MRVVKYYEVALRTLVRADAETFTYSSEEPLAIGRLVEVSVGKKSSVGVVWREISKPTYDVKPITSLLDTPSLPAPLLQTASWMSSYYQTHLATVLQTILPTGLTKKRRSQSVNHTPHIRNRTQFVFTEQQQHALHTFSKNPQKTVLLHGITGSGKTALYIEQAKRCVAAGRSAIVLVPEIALTSQLVAEFSHHFDDLILTHSKQTEAERHLIWLDAATRTTPTVAIGPRSALFLPLADIGSIMIDEFHEPSFKQDAAPRYQAQRVARILADHHNAGIILGSATPPIADYYLAQSSHNPIITLDKPATPDAIEPEVSVVDMTKRGNFTQHRFFSDTLLAHIQKTLDAGKQVLLFHNRRGSASSTLCANCGWQAGCAHCYVPLVLHIDTYQLICHLCGYKSRVPTSCPSCHDANIIHKGIGTKLIESEIRRLFPKASVARFDADTDTHETTEKRYQELYNGDIDIIIGTQVIAKGLDLPHLTLVGVVQADAGLSLPDYVSAERVFQLLVQVLGRVGRFTHETQVIVQTFQPEHPAVQDGINRAYQDFYTRTIALRKHTNFPPFCHLLKLTCIYKTEATAVKHAKALAAELSAKYPDVEILGPTPAFYERIRDTYRWQLLIKSPDRTKLQEITTLVPPKNWQVDLDPASLL